MDQKGKNSRDCKLTFLYGKSQGTLDKGQWNFHNLFRQMVILLLELFIKFPTADVTNYHKLRA